MKKISILILIALCALLLAGCDNEYKPVESTEEEARVIATLTYGESTYEVRYELYRALFLANKEVVDGGDASVWEGDGSEEYIARINEIIRAKVCEIYSAIHLAKALGYDAYSKDADKQIKEYIKGAVEGDDDQIGHGSYEAYLASLKDNYLNYSVATLLMRYSLSMTAINEYYGGTEHEVFGNMQGEYTYTADDVKSYYFSGDCARVMELYIPSGVKSKAWVEDFRAQLLTKSSELAMATHIIANTSATEADLIVDDEVSGIVIGKNSLDSFYYSAYLAKVFDVEAGEMSEVFELSGTEADGYYVIYGLEKSEEHFSRCYEQIRLSYIDEVIGGKIAEVSEALNASYRLSESYSEINHQGISME
ncbi:MAG: hypothetical protein IJW03_05115 [Clostridia bacterium]|nr:hypothetical protein [Clostridia bacterium]